MYPQALYPNTKRALALLAKMDIIKNFYLAGGTAAALQLGHRRSIDLDFFSNKSFDVEKILHTLSQISKFKIIDKNSHTLTGYWQRTRLEFFYYPYKLIQRYKIWDNVKIAGLQDIGLMKMIAIANRGSKKDFFDLYVISNEILSLDKMFTLLSKKYAKVNYDKYHLLKSLVYFDDADLDPDPDLLMKISWQDVKKYFVKNARRMLGEK